MDLARFIVRRRWWLLAAWLIAGLALIPAARRVEQVLEVAARIPGSESAVVEERLASGFGSPFARNATLVIRGVPSPDTPDGRRALEGVLAVLDTAPGVTQSLSYLSAPDTLLLAPDRAGTIVLVGLDPAGAPPDVLVPRLRAATEQLVTGLRREYPRATLRWTGEAALNFDVRRTSAADAEGAERRALPVTLALLLIAFGAVAAALLPILVGALSIPLTLGAASLLAEHWPLSILLVNVVTMIGLALGIDYALLTVARFREVLAKEGDAERAAEATVRSAGHTVLLSGAAVAIGFGALLAVPLSELRSVAVGGFMVTAFSVLLATTLLPGVLATLGNWIELGRFRRGRTGVGDGREQWRAWGRWVTAHPGRVLVVAGLPVLLLASQAGRMRVELPRGEFLSPSMESAIALKELQAMGRGGVVQTLRVLLELPQGAHALRGEGFDATRQLGSRLAEDPRTARVQSVPVVLRGAAPNPNVLARLPRGVLTSFVGEEGRATLVEVVPQQELAPPDLNQWVRQLRATDAATLTGLPGSRIRVGGLPALNADYEDTLGGWFFGVVALVVVATLIALGIGFRSVLVPIKAVALNLLSVGAAFGSTVLVFQDGWGPAWLAPSPPLGSLFPIVPLLVFCTVFGLSMDYEVFLVARVREARRAGLSEAEAVAEGLARTGGVITSAAAIMVAVFAAFTLGESLLIRMLGFALATAVLLDATVIRMAVGPALLRLAGRWNWWPGG